MRNINGYLSDLSFFVSFDNRQDFEPHESLNMVF